MNRLLAPMILILFIFSGLPLSSEQLHGSNALLRKVIEQVQSLSGQIDSENLDFAQSFRSTMTGLQTVAGLKTTIIKKTTKDGNDTNTVIVCVNLPYLLVTAAYLYINVSSSDLNISTSLIVDTSIILSLDTPPPIV